MHLLTPFEQDYIKCVWTESYKVTVECFSSTSVEDQVHRQGCVLL